MKKQKRQVSKAAAEPVGSPGMPAWWIWLIGLGALFFVFEAYGPALRSPFVLDDLYLPYGEANTPARLTDWLHFQRPLLMLSYWVNYQTGASDPHVYHTTNVFLHFLVSIIVTLIAARLLEWAGITGRMRTALAFFSGGIFLLHPLQTESVAYVASRSEVLSVLFYYSAFAVFIYSNRDAISWPRAIAVVALFGAAAATKEHTLTLPLLILLTDFFWRRGGWRKNAILYGLLALACVAGGVVVWKILLGADTAGFGMKGLSPVSYFFTQCRVIWTYVRMFFLPFGQNIDPDVPLSEGVLDHGAIFGLIALLAAVAWAWLNRKRWPLAAFGVFVFLLLIAPTSSVIPIRDVLAERRVYLPFLGLILIVLEPLRRLQLRTAIGACAAALLASTVLTYLRSDVWSTPLTLWQDSVAKSPGKVRPRFQLAFAQYKMDDCAAAVGNFEAAAQLDKPDYRLFIDWANALDCAGREDEAVAVFAHAIQLDRGKAEGFVGLSSVYGKQRKTTEALNVLARAQSIDPNIPEIYVNRGGVFEILGNTNGAVAEYRHALAIDPSNRTAREALRRLGQ